jgi:hypothetical protein
MSSLVVLTVAVFCLAGICFLITVLGRCIGPAKVLNVLNLVSCLASLFNHGSIVTYFLK